jgi:esterase/lipase superfamily enzyme
MEREQVELDAPGLDRPGSLIRYGHYGRPVLVFPSEQGRAWDYENNGMVGAVADLVEAGRVKLYCVDSYDHVSWSDRGIPLEERARRHSLYESWIVDQVVPAIGSDSPGAGDIVTTGCSLGAFHALNFALKRADLFPIAICQSGNYDAASWHPWGRARRRDVLQQPGRLPSEPGRRPPGLAPQPGLPAANRRPG